MGDDIGRIAGEYDDGDPWVATMGPDGRWRCDDEVIQTLLLAFSADRYEGPPMPLGIGSLYQAGREFHAKVEVLIDIVEPPEGVVF